MFNNLSIFKKLMINCLISIIILAVIGLLSYLGIQKATHHIEMVMKATPIMNAAMAAKTETAKTMLMFMELNTTSNNKELEDVWQEYQKIAAALRKEFKTIQTLNVDADCLEIHKENFTNIIKIIQNVDKQYETLIQTNIEQLHQLKIKQFQGIDFDNDTFNKIDDIFDKTGNQLIKQMDEVEKEIKFVMDDLQKSSFTVALNTGKTNLFAILSGIIILLISSQFLARIITKPLINAVELIKTISNGDFTQKINIDQQDEVGQLAQAMNSMVTKLKIMFRDLQRGSTTINITAEELTNISEQMKKQADFTKDKAVIVSSAAEEMSVSMNSVATIVEQATGNVNMVAASMEEMTATVQEIAKNAERGQVVTNNAVTVAEDTTQKIEDLDLAAREINKVTEAITEISEQTNLLALNATIEAARAGEAGKGFAVVANEIKDLAKQTSLSSHEIKQKIAGIQETTQATVAGISKIAQVINEINENVSGIASAVEEQAATASEISSNIAQASSGINEMNEAIAQSAAVAQEITRDIQEVSITAIHSAENTDEVRASIIELSDLSAELTNMAESVNIGSSRFNIGSIKKAHLAWKGKLTQVVSGELKMQPSEVTSHHACELGKWIKEESAKKDGLSNENEFKIMIRHHEKVHTLAADIVKEVNQGNTETVGRMLHAFNETRLALFKSLDVLYKD